MFERLSPREYEQSKVDGLNACEGQLHEEDGYHCSICKNKGYIVRLKELPGERYSTSCSLCKCMDTRNSIKRMKESGLKDIIKDYTFEKFEVSDAWQRAVKEKAEQYAKAPKGWFFIGGQSGAGKTHLCTAICREFLLDGHQVVYMLWRDDISKLKALAIEEGQRTEMINRFKQAEILYIDDLFKTGAAPDGTRQRPTSADINTAFEIINFRYNNADRLTIVSSEWSQDELLDIDEATGGRIFERTGSNGISIARDRSRNYRTRRTVTL